MPDVTRLHLIYRARLERLRSATVTGALRADGSEDAARLVLAAQRQVVAEVDAYMSLEAGLATGSSTDPWGLDASQLIGQSARRGRTLEDVYGANWASDFGSFVSRITREVNTDVSLAERGGAYVHTEGDSRIVGSRRVLGSGPNCGLCVAAATRRYFKQDLRPVHHNCGCTTQAIYSEADAPQWTKPTNDFLRGLYRAAGSTNGRSLGRIEVTDADLPPGIRPGNVPAAQIVADRELGPMLVPA